MINVKDLKDWNLLIYVQELRSIGYISSSELDSILGFDSVEAIYIPEDLPVGEIPIRFKQSKDNFTINRRATRQISDVIVSPYFDRLLNELAHRGLSERLN